MKSSVEYMVNDVVLYSKGLDSAIKKDNISEAKKYVEKISKQLKSVNKYLKVKDQVRKMTEYNLN